MGKSLKTRLLVKSRWIRDCPFILVYFSWRIQTGWHSHGQGCGNCSSHNLPPPCGKPRWEHLKGVNEEAPGGAGHLPGCLCITLQLRHATPASAFKAEQSWTRLCCAGFASLPSYTMYPRWAVARDWQQDTCAHYITGRAQAVVVCAGETL